MNTKAREPYSSTLWVVYGAHRFITREELALGTHMDAVQVDHQGRKMKGMSAGEGLSLLSLVLECLIPQSVSLAKGGHPSCFIVSDF